MEPRKLKAAVVLAVLVEIFESLQVETSITVLPQAVPYICELQTQAVTVGSAEVLQLLLGPLDLEVPGL